MNFQKKPPYAVGKILKMHGRHSDRMDYYAWPEVFGSTAGPHGGVGGSAISSFTVEAYTDGSFTIYLCGKMYAVKEGPFEQKNPKTWSKLDSMDKELELRRAWEEGYLTNMNGGLKKFNPFAENSDLYDAWNEGYSVSEEKYGKVEDDVREGSGS